MRKHTSTLAVAAAISLAACNDSSTAPASDEMVDVSFNTALVGFSELNTSFAPGDGEPSAFMPGMERGPGLAGPRGPRQGGGPMGGPGGGVMGGGLDLAFAGGVPRGQGPRHGPFGFPNVNNENCEFDAASGDVVCENERHGLSVTRIISWRTLDGTPQQSPNASTHSARVRVTVAGTITRQNVTVDVDHESDRTVTGLSEGSTSRTVNGTSRGEEVTEGTNRQGQQFTATRIAGDTITGVVVPLQDNRPPYPTAGTVIRSMKVTVVSGSNSNERTRREVITYDGSATAKVVITVNGETRNCTMPLPRGRLTCE